MHQVSEAHGIAEATRVQDLTDELRRELTIHYVTHVEEVLAIALTPSSAQSHTGLPLDDELRQTVQ